MISNKAVLSWNCCWSLQTSKPKPSESRWIFLAKDLETKEAEVQLVEQDIAQLEDVFEEATDGENE